MSMMESIFGPKKLTKEQQAKQSTRVEDRDKAETMADASHGDRSFAADMRTRAQEHKDFAKVYDKDSYEAKDLNFAARRNLDWAVEHDQKAEKTEDAMALRHDYIEKLKNMTDDELKMALQEVLAYKEQAVKDADVEAASGGERAEYRKARIIDSEAQMIEKMIKAREHAKYTKQGEANTEDRMRGDLKSGLDYLEDDGFKDFTDRMKKEKANPVALEKEAQEEFLKRKLNAEYDAYDENRKRENGEKV